MVTRTQGYEILDGIERSPDHGNSMVEMQPTGFIASRIAAPPPVPDVYRVLDRLRDGMATGKRRHRFTLP